MLINPDDLLKRFLLKAGLVVLVLVGLALALFAGGCSNGPYLARYTVIGIEPAAEEFVADMLEGAALWEPYDAHIVIDDSETYKQLRCATWDQGSAAAVTNAAGIALDCEWMRKVSHEYRVHVLAHEIGHTFSLHHVDDPLAIMYGKSATPTVALTQADVDEYGVWNLRSNLE